jgi:hypothetical protein
MMPLIRYGDNIILTLNEKQPIAVGEIITFWHAYAYTTHRVVQVENGQFLTKGDASLQMDTPVRTEQILGKVSSVTRGSGKLSMAKIPAFYRFGQARVSRLQATVSEKFSTQLPLPAWVVRTFCSIFLSATNRMLWWLFAEQNSVS